MPLSFYTISTLLACVCVCVFLRATPYEAEASLIVLAVRVRQYVYALALLFFIFNFFLLFAHTSVQKFDGALRLVSLVPSHCKTKKCFAFLYGSVCVGGKGRSLLFVFLLFLFLFSMGAACRS